MVKINAAMRITITIARRNAQALVQTQQQIKSINTAAAGTGRAAAGVGAGLGSMAGQAGAAAGRLSVLQRIMNTTQGPMARFGKNIQWIGRQIQYNFTLPILAGIGAAAMWQNRNEEAFTELKKIYGAGLPFGQAERDLELFREGFRLLSDEFGVHQDEVIHIGAIWAQAGAQGERLASGVKLTLQTMILGSLGAEEAATALITVTQAYGLSTEELTVNLAYLNQIENETAIGFGDLITVIQSAGGAAVAAGIDIRHLGALAAALVPAAADASVAGSTLRSVLLQLADPSNEAIQAFQTMGIQIDTIAWGTKNYEQRIEALAGAYEGLTQNQKLQFASELVGIRQGARLLRLLQDVTDAHGAYQTALNATGGAEGDAAAALTQFDKEIQIFLESSPQAWKILSTRVMNDFAAAVTPLIPLLQRMAYYVSQATDAFSKLDPQIQQFVLIALLGLAVIGPFARYVGATLQLIGLLRVPFILAGGAVRFFTVMLGRLVIMLLGPVAAAFGVPVWAAALIAAAIAAAAFVAYKFRDDIQRVAEDVGHTVAQYLPQSFLNGMVAIIGILRGAAQAVVNFFSYLNPFARHSPSLVDNVVAGVATIAAEYAKLDDATASLDTAKNRLQEFADATAAARASIEGQELAKQRDIVTTQAPGSGGTFDALADSIRDLKDQLPELQTAIDAQQRVVTEWESRLDIANDTLDKVERKLDDLRTAATLANEELNNAQAILSDLATTPIAGMQAFEDQIFANEQAQKRLRLEILRMEQAGDSIDEIRDKLAALQGDIEQLLGMREGLRLQGAGSDILGPLDDQLAALRAQQQALEGGAGGGIEALQKQLEDLQRQGEILDLEKSLQFDPLTRQIEHLTSAVQEVPFDQLVAQIIAQQGAVKELEHAWRLAEDAVKQQEAAVAVAKASRDEISQGVDDAKDSLKALEDQYAAIESAIRSAEQAINDFSTAAAASGGAAAAGGGGIPGDFADAAGVGGGLEGQAGDLQALIDEWSNAAQAQFGSLNILQPVKDKFNEVLDWLHSQNWDWNGIFDVPGLGIAIDAVTTTFQEVADSSAIQYLVDQTGRGTRQVRSDFERLARWIEPRIGHLLPWIADQFDYMVDRIGPRIREFKDLFLPLATVIGAVVAVVYVIVRSLVVVFGAVFPQLSSIVTTIFRTIVDTIAGALRYIHGFLQLILGLITGDWGLAWEGITNIFGGFKDIIVAQVGGFAEIIKTILVGAFDGLVQFFTVWKGLVVDLMHLVWDDIVQFWGFIEGWIQTLIIDPFNFLKDTITEIFSGIKNWINDRWNEVKGFFTGTATWLAENITTPFDVTYGLVMTVWQEIKDFISDRWDDVKAIFTGVGDWFKTNLVDPIIGVKDDLVSALDDIKAGFQGIFEGLAALWRTPLDGARAVLNAFINGINTVTGVFGIPSIPTFPPLLAGGGTLGGGGGNVPAPLREMATGGVFNKATAIVGEGNGSFPEYVIPTDPKYRGRAMDLYDQLSRALGLEMMAVGGFVPGFVQDIGGGIAGGIGSAFDAAQEAALKAALAGPAAVIDAAIGAMPDHPWMAGIAKTAARYLKNEIYDWAVGYKSGSATLPHDEFAYLHKGERVLNAQQNKMYSPEGASNGNGRTIIFNGDLVFPNVRGPEDAKGFITKLEAIV